MNTCVRMELFRHAGSNQRPLIGADGSSMGLDHHAHPRSLVCVAVIGVHTCVSARSASTWVGIFDHRQSYRRPATMIMLKKQVNKLL